MTDIQKLVKDQRTYFNQGKTLSYEARVQAIKKLEKVVRENENLIFQALKADLSKPDIEIYTSELDYFYHEIKYTLKRLKKWMKPKIVIPPLYLLPSIGRVTKKPYGVNLIIGPWNYPFQLTLVPAITALAAGNTAVLKPSEITSNTELIIKKIINENFDPSLLHVITGGIEETTILLDQKFDFIFFTGSTNVGKIVAAKAAKHLTPTCLELGGKSPCIIDESANIKVAARRVAWAKSFNSGQTCIAPDYLLIHEKVYDQFLLEFKKCLLNFIKGKESVSSIVNKKNFQRLNTIVEQHDVSSVEILGENILSELYMAPTLIYNPSEDSPAMNEEIFGPITPIMKFSNLKDAHEVIAKKERPLALYLFSENKKSQRLIFENLTYGNGALNDCLIQLTYDMPFGGVGESGMGNYHGIHGYNTFTYQCSTHQSITLIDPSLRYPPYSQLKIKILRWITSL